ncbi:unnamed protein product [Didymodactylos carnosus]|uniref:Uncharacterized protein n=1 Tax=Didymodactylos carnosus TaxID=1234261 RepID=A0A815BGF9_9BILA|nr:unnamed protein product [Didymodactylos carnosus]CAF1302911.1 unnamed protein product [Didymodactylos carnosus]CAF4055723.1 unnamed protein product [Didymodactylos carnosus]CAF4109486.1 unnamed protein product [Didymodactylos carnosus]
MTNPANIIQYLSALVKNNLDMKQIEPSQKEHKLAKHLADTLTSLNDYKHFEYDEVRLSSTIKALADLDWIPTEEAFVAE